MLEPSTTNLSFQEKIGPSTGKATMTSNAIRKKSRKRSVTISRFNYRGKYHYV